MCACASSVGSLITAAVNPCWYISKSMVDAVTELVEGPQVSQVIKMAKMTNLMRSIMSPNPVEGLPMSAARAAASPLPPPPPVHNASDCGSTHCHHHRNEANVQDYQNHRARCTTSDGAWAMQWQVLQRCADRTWIAHQRPSKEHTHTIG
jgi:hypothetical protein